MSKDQFYRSSETITRILCAFLFFAGWIALSDAMYSSSARAIRVPFFIWVMTIVLCGVGFIIRRSRNKPTLYYLIVAALSGASMLYLASHIAL